MMMRQTGVFAYGMCFEIALFRGYTIDVHGAVATLCGYIFIQRVPSDALHIVAMFSNLVDTFT
jgi:hypothetical protein